MPKVTSLKQQLKNDERVSVFIDGAYSFSLSYTEILEQKITNRSELSAEDIVRLKKMSMDGKLKARAMEWLMSRPRSVRELSQYLYKKKAEKQLIDSLCHYFIDKGYLDDTRYAHWLCDLRRRKGVSERIIRSELAFKGVSAEIIDDVLTSDSADSSEQERLLELIAKKRNSSRYKQDPSKLVRFLLAKGFRYEDISTCLRVDTDD